MLMPIPDTAAKPLTADIAVAGGGSSGAVIAARLAGAGADALLVEAGPDDGPFGSGRHPRHGCAGGHPDNQHNARFEFPSG